MSRSRGVAMALGGLLAIAMPAAAIDDNAGTGGASFLKMGSGSARAMALGRAYCAIAEGAESLTWNPAGLALTQQREGAYSYLRYIQGVDAPLHLAYAHPLGRTVFGANVVYMNVGEFDARQVDGRPDPSQNVEVRNGYGTISMARSFMYEKLFVGGSLKTVFEDNAGNRHSNIVGDLGVILKPNQTISFGFTTQNFGSSQSQVGRMTRIGGALRVLELLQLSMDLNKASDSAARLGLGAEFTLPEDLLEVGQISLRVGYYNADDQGRLLEGDRHMLYPLVGAQGLSFGLGVFSAQAFGYGISFDYALVPMGALGTVDQLTVKVKF
ncbi:MAG: hypothetical protein HY554_13365 [Elusimicrobia bacterium]|nr:hypothetical protein [Elusimicrobiota bacterium]